MLSLTLPVLLGGLISWSWWGALTAFFWAGPVRIAALHHVTWSTNSLPHDRKQTVHPARPINQLLAAGHPVHGRVLAQLHHADPTCARHGVHRGQLDMTARLIWIFEKFGWAHDLRWPSPRRLARVAAVQ